MFISEGKCKAVLVIYAFLLYLDILDILDQVVHRQISMIDESHRKAVVAIEFMPATLEVRWL